MSKNHCIWVGAGMVVLALTGGVHGLWTDRWRTLPELADAAATLAAIPRQLGPWQGKDMELDAADVEQAGYAGSLWRRYDNRQDGAAVSMLLICGRPGPICVHTPDICYRGGGYDVVTEPAQISISAPPAPAGEFWKARFAKASASNPRQLCIWWAWNAGQGWQAPSSPRLAFSRFPVLFKLYLVCESQPGNAAERDPCAALLPLLLPKLQSAVDLACAGQ